MTETQICLRQFSEIELSLQTPTIMFAAKLLLVLGSITVLSLRGEAAGAVCGQRSTYPTIQALPGKPGKKGAPGPKGEPGVDGRDGEQGPVGPVGPQGPVGPVGPQGIAGMNGTDGEQGPVGPVGPQGPVGPVGPVGSQGPVGPVGSQGLVGAPGLDGRNGSDGSPGPPGTVPDAVIEQLREDILEEVLKLLPCKGFFMNNPATSCKEIYKCDSTAPSGYYWVRNATGDATQVFCEMNTTNCGNITGGWTRAAYIDMTDENNTCPQGLTYTVVNSTRMCTRSHTNNVDCSSVTFPTHGVPYTKVCGRAGGYQFYGTAAFFNYHHRDQTTLDSAYVAGLSVTFRSPRSHIWTFAAGYSKDYGPGYGCCNCPCASPYPGLAAPPFVGENFFCKSGNSGELEYQWWYLDDPLWDSQGCASGGRVGPWFTTTLSQEVRDDIEMRMCSTHVLTTENIGVDELEIYTY